MRNTLSMLFLVLFAGSAAADPTVTDPAIERLASLRQALDRIEDAERAVNVQKTALESRLEVLAAEIERQKAARSARWLPDLELEQKLRQSQELSVTLTLLNREIGALRQTRAARQGELLQAYDTLIAGLAGKLRRGQGLSPDQLALLKRMREEREALWARVAPPATTPHPLDPKSLLATDDPEELRDRQDTVRDEQDRLRRELGRLDKSLAQLAEDERLEQEMHDFLQEQEIFDERARLLRLDKSAPVGDTDEAADPVEPGGNDPGEGFGGDTSALPSGMFPVGLSPESATASGRKPAREELHEHRLRVVEELKKLQVLSDRLAEKIESLTSSP